MNCEPTEFYTYIMNIYYMLPQDLFLSRVFQVAVRSFYEFLTCLLKLAVYGPVACSLAVESTEAQMHFIVPSSSSSSIKDVCRLKLAAHMPAFAEHYSGWKIAGNWSCKLREGLSDGRQDSVRFGDGKI